MYEKAIENDPHAHAEIFKSLANCYFIQNPENSTKPLNILE
jgi:hypothetical protein